MEEVRYMISEASKRVDVNSHVLRYWQKELALPISRNEMDQRYYKESDIELLIKIKELKEQGYQMKAIKMLLPNLETPDSQASEDVKIQQKEGREDKVDELIHEDKQSEKEVGTSLIAEEESEVKEDEGSKMGQFKAIMNHIILNALKENNGVLSSEVSVNVTDNVIREMNYLMRIKEEKEEERFRKFDAALRDYQKSRLLSAATIEKGRKKSKFFKKNNVHI